MIQSVVTLKSFNPREVPKDMVDLAAHNAKVSLNNKFELISRDESRTIKAIEELGTQMGIQTPIRIEASIILIFKVWIQCQQWLHLSTVNQIRKIIESIKSKRLKVQMITNQ